MRMPNDPSSDLAPDDDGGVVSHLRWVENLWFEVLFLGRPAKGPQFDGEKSYY